MILVFSLVKKLSLRETVWPPFSFSGVENKNGNNQINKPLGIRNIHRKYHRCR